jgi:hypothetical protein
MARTPGNFDFPLNFEGLLKAPIDAKQLVGTYADLTNPATWNASGQVWLYNGAIVSVSDDGANNGIYFLNDASNYTVGTSWLKIPTGTTSLAGYWTSAQTVNYVTGYTSGFTTGNTFVESGGTLIGVNGNEITIFSPPSIGWSNLLSGSTVVGCGTPVCGTPVGNNNTLYGVNAGSNIGVYACDNVAIGTCALFSNTGGSYNIGIGSSSIWQNLCGNYNIGIGAQALNTIVCGTDNTAIGSGALQNSVCGCNNVAIGLAALLNNLVGSNNVAIGKTAGQFETGSNRLHIANTNSCSLIYGEFDNQMVRINGSLCVTQLPAKSTETNIIYIDANGKLSSGATSSGGIGWSNLANASTVAGCGTPISGNTFYNTIYGVEAGKNMTGFTPTNNIAIGRRVLYNNTGGSNNIGIGMGVFGSLYNNTTGQYNVAIGNDALSQNNSGGTNTAVGTWALQNNIGGSRNTAIGMGAQNLNCYGGCNVAIGYASLQSNETGSNNVAIGNGAGFSETGSNKLYIANCDTCSLIYGEFDTQMLKIDGCLCVTKLPAKSTETNIVYIDASGKFSSGATPTSGLLTANNGLCASGTNVRLGGALTGTTSITGVGKMLCIGSTTNALCGFGVVVSGTSSSRSASLMAIKSTGFANGVALVYACNSSANNVATMSAAYPSMGSNISACHNGLNIQVTCTGGCCTYISMNSANQDMFIRSTSPTFAGAQYYNDYSPYFVARSLVDAGFVTGITSTIGGDKNNIYSISTGNTGTTLLTTGSSYLILVNHPSGASTIILPTGATITQGFAVKIKDASYNANTYNITICSCVTRYIDDSSSTSALINTNGGAYELAYDQGLNKWFTLSVVN